MHIILFMNSVSSCLVTILWIRINISNISTVVEGMVKFDILFWYQNRRKPSCSISWARGYMQTADSRTKSDIKYASEVMFFSEMLKGGEAGRTGEGLR